MVKTTSWATLFVLVFGVLILFSDRAAEANTQDYNPFEALQRRNYDVFVPVKRHAIITPPGTHYIARRSPDGHVIQPYPNRVTLEFQIFGRLFRETVSLIKIAADGERYLSRDPVTDEIVSLPIVHSSYRGTTKFGWIVATLEDDGSFHALLYENKTFYTVVPSYIHSGNMKRRDLESSVMVAYRDDDLDTSGHGCGSGHVGDAPQEPVYTNGSSSHGHGAHADQYRNANLFERALVGQLPDSSGVAAKFSGCYDGIDNGGTLAFKLRVVTDISFNALFSNNARKTLTYISQAFNSMNSIYYYQLGIYVTLVNADFTRTKVNASEPWSQATTGTYLQGVGQCALRIDEVVNLFSSYVANMTSNATINEGSFFLLSNCFPPPGIVGLAYVASTCANLDPLAFSGSNVGVVTFSATTWKTLAHELGHNFGANHAFQLGQGVTGGIMDYGDGKYQSVYQFHPIYNRNEICTQINTTLQLKAVDNTKCYTTYAAVCGNGLIEEGEDCDDTSSCCNSATCKFSTGSECSPDTECCTVTSAGCKLADTSTICDTGGICVRGVCSTSSCAAFSNLRFCSVDTNPCQQLCALTSDPNNCQTASNFGADPNVRDGARCKVNGVLGTCISGSCALNTFPTFSPDPVLVVGVTPGTAVTTPARSPLPGNWLITPYGSCEGTCGVGVQRRLVNCRFADATRCDATLKPSANVSCSLPACGPQWTMINEYGSCSRTCGGLRAKKLICQSLTTSGIVNVTDDVCSGLTVPITVKQPCSNDPTKCPTTRYMWAYASDSSSSPWGSCKGTCSQSYRVRNLYCIDTSNNSTIVSSTLCDTDTTPDVWTDPCTQTACFVQSGDLPSAVTASKSETALYVGSSAGGVGVIAIIVGGVLFARYRKRIREKESVGREKYRAKEEFQPKDKDLLRFRKGDIVLLVEGKTPRNRFGEGHLYGRNDRTLQEGFFEISMVNKVDTSRLMLVTKRLTVANRVSMFFGGRSGHYVEKDFDPSNNGMSSIPSIPSSMNSSANSLLPQQNNEPLLGTGYLPSAPKPPPGGKGGRPPAGQSYQTSAGQNYPAQQSYPAVQTYPATQNYPAQQNYPTTPPMSRSGASSQKSSTPLDPRNSGGSQKSGYDPRSSGGNQSVPAVQFYTDPSRGGQRPPPPSNNTRGSQSSGKNIYDYV